MTRLIVAGIGLGVLQLHREKNYRPEIEGWEVVFCHSEQFKSDLWSCWDAVLDCAKGSSADGAHIVAFHNVWRDRKEFDALVRYRHRLVWLEQSDLSYYATEQFTSTLQAVAKFEEEWRHHIRPPSTNSGLILPQGTFEVKARFEDLWAWAQRIGRVGGDIAGLREHLARLRRHLDWFTEEHHVTGTACWIDVGGRRFNSKGPRHGIHGPLENRWKFTFRVPAGFHYDVRPEKNPELFLTDHAGVRRQYNTYTNVDCHGYVWGGK